MFDGKILILDPVDCVSVRGRITELVMCGSRLCVRACVRACAGGHLTFEQASGVSNVDIFFNFYHQ